MPQLLDFLFYILSMTTKTSVDQSMEGMMIHMKQVAEAGLFNETTHWLLDMWMSLVKMNTVMNATWSNAGVVKVSWLSYSSIKINN